MGSSGRAVHLVTSIRRPAVNKILETKRDKMILKLFLLTVLAVILTKAEDETAAIKGPRAPLLIRRAQKDLISTPELDRQEKSLVNTFPFNAQENDHHDHHEHHEDHDHHEHHEDHGAHGDQGRRVHSIINPLQARQGYGEASEQDSPDFSEIAESGKKCIQKVMMVEETVWEDHEQCDHSYDKRCHKSFTTTYQSQQEEECDEVFRKICYIEM